MVTEVNNNNNKYTSSGQGDLNTVLGAIGTAGVLGLFGGGGINIGGGNRPPPVSQRELDAHAASERELAEKDAEIARLKGEKYADAAVLAAERRLADKIEKIETTMTTGFRNQGEYNVANTAAVAGLRKQTDALLSMAGIIINAPAMAASQAAAAAFTGAAGKSGGTGGTGN